MSKHKIIPFTGQPGSGKTALAKELIQKYPSRFILYDGDEIRGIFKNYDYTQKGRLENINRGFALAELSSSESDIIISMVAPYKELRDKLKSFNKADVFEIYLHTTEIRFKEDRFCKEYEKPTENYLNIDTGRPILECIREIENYCGLSK